MTRPFFKSFKGGVYSTLAVVVVLLVVMLASV